ncbi:MAG: hypothetical protein QOF60_3276 [Actinomycetota bacterium]|jgi:MFS family permease|nr:hypothetical protein [Actinomycetota bacterium]
MAESPWAPLRTPIFRALFIAQLASNVGTLMQSVGASWFIGDLGGSPGLVALVQTATYLPIFLLGIPSGALADIVDRRRLLLVTQMSMMAVVAALSVLAFTHHVTPASLLALTFVLGAAGAMNGPAWQATQPDLVPPKHFGQAVALGALTYNVGRAIGPAFGGFVLASLGAPWVFVFNFVSFLGIVVVLAMWRPAPTAPRRAPAETLAGATRAALRYGIHSPVLRGVLARVVLLGLPASALQALLPSTVRESLHLNASAYGLFLGGFGLGAAMAVAARPRVEQWLSPDQMVTLASITVAGALVVNGLVHQPVIVGVSLFLAGTSWTGGFTTLNVAAQATLPRWVRARGLGLYMLTLTGSFALGAAVWGEVANHNLEAAYAIAAALAFAGVLASRRWPLTPTQGLDMSAIVGEDPVVAMSPSAGDGPVLVTVAYRVQAADVARFTDAIRLVEKQRRRTGAYQWDTYQDLNEPDLYLEVFLVESWAEHVRQHHRRTASEADSLSAAYEFLVTQGGAHYVSIAAAQRVRGLRPTP